MGKVKKIFKILCLAIFLFNISMFSFAQKSANQVKLNVKSISPIHFGTFCITGANGGTVTLNYNGTRTSTGSIMLLPQVPIAQASTFEVKVCPPRNLFITYDATTILTGTLGGQLTLDIGPTNMGGSGASFMSDGNCNWDNPIIVGGTLHVPGTAVPDTYSGSFAITFNQE